jgi:fermentation-respiration switch protein FrsA (DUF1100 family)
MAGEQHQLHAPGADAGDHKVDAVLRNHISLKSHDTTLHLIPLHGRTASQIAGSASQLHGCLVLLCHPVTATNSAALGLVSSTTNSQLEQSCMLVLRSKSAGWGEHYMLVDNMLVQEAGP